MTEKYRIELLLADSRSKIGDFEAGTPVMEVLRTLHPGFAFPCNGRGTCGKCRVRVAEGEVSPPNEQEMAFLGPELIHTGIRLACQCKITGSVCFALAVEESGSILRAGEAKQNDFDPFCRIYLLNKANSFPWSWEELQEVFALQFPKETANPLEVTLPALQSLAALPAGVSPVMAEVVENRVVRVSYGPNPPRQMGVAVDLGTTTLAAYLVDLSNGRILETAAEYNPQRTYGADLINRITHAAEPGGLEQLRAAVTGAINRLLGELTVKAGIATEEILRIHLAGNSVMTMLLLGVSPAGLGRKPFIPAFTSALRLTPLETGININPAGVVCILPGIGGFVGADLTAGIMACGLAPDRTEMLIDLGTNGEIILTGKGRILAASTAAGPAFEGANIACGMTATAGAITDFKFTPDGIWTKTLHDALPKGICGSGLFRIVTEMLAQGMISETGRWEVDASDPNYDPESKQYYLARGEEVSVYLSQGDIRQLQLAKGAIRAGVELLLEHLGVRAEELDTIYLAGAFGTYLQPGDALRLGLLPRVSMDRIRAMGNTAGAGTVQSLLSRRVLAKVEETAIQVEHIELAELPGFTDRFAEAMFFGE